MRYSLTPYYRMHFHYYFITWIHIRCKNFFRFPDLCLTNFEALSSPSALWSLLTLTFTFSRIISHPSRAFHHEYRLKGNKRRLFLYSNTARSVKPLSSLWWDGIHSVFPCFRPGPLIFGEWSRFSLIILLLSIYRATTPFLTQLTHSSLLIFLGSLF